MALFPYFPRLWTTEGVTGLRSFFLFFCVFLLYLSAKLLEIQQNNCRQMEDALFLSALLLHGSKRTSGQQSLYEKIGPATVWCKCMSVACWVPTLLHNCWSFWGLRRRCHSKLNSLREISLCLLVGWFLGRHRCTFQHFKLCCGVKWLCSHDMVSMWRREKKEKKKNTNDIF